ncbi:MAG TPA: twin-arginine translocation pathway signal [Cytophagales bacterium]|nr:twin-arginine translocation pathway signal [Cytophagales bacterium]HAA17839.1 twin-arginine translocation pathway signal [Cytophagales bacterium]HAP58239.1 twin-arginine translocation pathway signal [Cytophagales bacterium]
MQRDVNYRGKFFFTRIQYDSGDWNTDQRMPSNLLHSLVQYTTIAVDTEEKVVPLASDELFQSPFCYLSGHKLVQFNAKERANFKKYVENGGFVFVDDCNHDIDGLFAKSFEAQMAEIFGPEALQKIPNDHELYSCFFEFEKGPPATSVELNGWGDDIIHKYLKAITVKNRIGVLYSNKDYGCEWDYDFRNKRWYKTDNTRFGVNIVVHALTR